MKIAFVGNQGNNAYRVCKWMREAGYDTRLYAFREDTRRSRPARIDPEAFREGSPDWFTMIRFHALGLSPPRLYRHIAQEHDVIITSGERGLLTTRFFRDQPLVHLVLGSELVRLPFLWAARETRVRRRATSLLARLSLRHADVFAIRYFPAVRALTRLRVVSKARLWGFPEDVAGNPERIDRALLGELNRRFASYDLVPLWLSRLNFRDTRSHEYKGPERFLEAFRKLALDDKRNVHAVIGFHGLDKDAFRTRVAECNLDSHVTWVPHLSYRTLLTYLSIDNAVAVDDLNDLRGVISGLARDALSVGSIVIKSFDPMVNEILFGPGCPILSAENAQQCYQILATLLREGKSGLRSRRAEHKAWAHRYMVPEHHVGSLYRICQEVAYVRRCQKVQVPF